MTFSLLVSQNIAQYIPDRFLFKLEFCNHSSANVQLRDNSTSFILFLWLVDLNYLSIGHIKLTMWRVQLLK